MVRLENDKGQAQLVLSIPPEREKEVAQALEALLKADDKAATESRLLDVIITAAEQGYFWTPEWQADEQEIDDQLSHGEYETFDSMDDMLTFLDQQ
jgi:hypothetical protein